jgi:hypothetical protein
MKIVYEHLSKTVADGSVDECIKATFPEGTEKYIPLDPANSDYAEYLASLEATPAKATKTKVVEEPVAPEEE